jgi:plastocyanin
MENLWTKCRGHMFLVSCLFLLNSCSSAPEKTTQGTTIKATPYEVHTVEIKDMKFVPDSIIVKKGDEVVFINRDIVTHCVTEEVGKAWTSSALASGESYLLVVTESSKYYCAIHKVMKGKIIVQ